MTFEHIIEWSPAYNHVPDGKGRHCVEVRFVLKGEKAAIQFLLMTGWNHSSDRRPDHMIECPDGVLRPEHIRAMPADIGYHAREPQYEGQHSQDDCRYLNGAPCYYDGSGTRAEHFFTILTDEGGEALWKSLEDEYEARFIVGVPSTINNVGFGELIRTVFGTGEES